MNKIYISITPFFPTPFSFRGPYVLDQVKALQRLSDYKVVVLKPKPWYVKTEDYMYEGIQVYRFSSFELPSNIMPGLFNFLSVWSLKRKLKKIGINPKEIAVVHTHVTGLGVYANALKKVNPKLTSVLQHHGLDVLSLENGILRDKKWHQSWVRQYGVNICKAIDLHIGVSQKTLDQFVAFPNIKLKETYVLYNGVDLKKFYPIQGTTSSTKFVVGCIGNFWPLKDHETLIKAFSILVKETEPGHVLLKLVGTGATRAACLELVKKEKLLNLVEFIDSVPHDKLVMFYSTLDLFVLPSYHEAFGCVYNEAHACGVPFIAVEGQGIAEIISPEDRNLFLISKGDYISLADRMKQLKVSPRQQKLTINYNINRLVEDYLHYLVH